jgi:hypothetical protein
MFFVVSVRFSHHHKPALRHKENLEHMAEEPLALLQAKWKDKIDRERLMSNYNQNVVSQMLDINVIGCAGSTSSHRYLKI